MAFFDPYRDRYQPENQILLLEFSYQNLENFETVTVMLFFMMFISITVMVAVYSIEKVQKMKILSVTDIALKFLFLIL